MSFFYINLHFLNHFPKVIVADMYTWSRSMVLRFHSLVWTQRKVVHGRSLKEENMSKSISIYDSYTTSSLTRFLSHFFLHIWLCNLPGKQMKNLNGAPILLGLHVLRMFKNLSIKLNVHMSSYKTLGLW